MCVFTCMCVHTRFNTCMYIVWIALCYVAHSSKVTLYIYIYIYIHTYIHTHPHAHTYILACSASCATSHSGCAAPSTRRAR